MEVEAVLREVRAARARLAKEGPAVTRPFEGDFERVSLPERECDVLRDALVAERACVVIRSDWPTAVRRWLLGRPCCRRAASARATW